MEFRGEILFESFVVSVFMELKGKPMFREGPVRELRVRHRPRVMSLDAAGMWSIRAVLSVGRKEGEGEGCLD